MSSLLDYKSILKNSRVVYYPELGYMVPIFRYSSRELCGDSWIDFRVFYHLKRIRLLCLYFDKILIPFSHVHVSANENLLEVVTRLMIHPDFRTLVDNKIIVLAGWGGSTKEEIQEHQISILREIEWRVQLGERFRKTKPTFDNIDIVLRENVGDQSKSLFSRIIDLINRHKQSPLEHISSRLYELAMKSEFRDIPFLHETFWLSLIKESSNEKLMQDFILATNKIYYEVGEDANPGVIVYHVETAEDGIPRFSKATSVNVHLYAPYIFEATLLTYLEIIEVNKLYRIPILDFLKLRDNEWKIFCCFYHCFLEELSIYLYGGLKVRTETKTIISSNQNTDLKDFINNMLRIFDNGSIVYFFCQKLKATILYDKKISNQKILWQNYNEIKFSNKKGVFKKMKVFISHSSSDKGFAEALIELLKAAFNLPPAEIRCTSVDGYRLPAGAVTDEQLRDEIHNSTAFIALLSESSIQSTYVMFELGARWGLRLHLVPLIAPNCDSRIIEGPLRAVNAFAMASPVIL